MNFPHSIVRHVFATVVLISVLGLSTVTSKDGFYFLSKDVFLFPDMFPVSIEAFIYFFVVLEAHPDVFDAALQFALP